MLVSRIAGASVALLCLASTVAAQQVTITAPNHNVQNSFNENIGVNFGFNLRTNITPQQFAQLQAGARARPSATVGFTQLGGLTPNIPFTQGSAAGAVPPFGGFNPANVAQTGAAISGKAGTMFFNVSAGQGATTASTMEAPMVTLTNGVPGSFSDQTQTPFVTSVTPVVGGWVPGSVPGYTTGPMMPAAQVAAPPSYSPLMDRLQRLQAGEGAAGGGSNAAPPAPAPPRPVGFRDQMNAAAQSTAGQGTASIAELQEQRALVEQTGDDAATKLLERGEQAAEAGKPGVAKIYYRMAAKEASGALKQQAEQKLRDLEGASTQGAAPQ